MTVAEEDVSGAVRAAAVAALGAVCSPSVDGGSANDTAYVVAGSSDGCLPLSDAIAAVAALLEDVDSSCRASAILALVRLGAASDFTDEIAALMGDRAAGVRSAAQAALR